MVEDAEEELKKMGRGEESTVVVTGVGRQSGTYPTQNVRTRSQRSRSGSTSVRGERGRRASEGANSTAGSTQGGEATEDSVETTGRVKKDREEVKKGRLLSFGIVLFLALLVLLATAASRRFGSSE